MLELQHIDKYYNPGTVNEMCLFKDFSQSVEAGIAAMAQGAATFAGNVPSPAAAGNVLDVGAEAWNQVGGVFAGPAQDTGRVAYEYGLTNKERVPPS